MYFSILQAPLDSRQHIREGRLYSLKQWLPESDGCDAIM